MITSFYDYVGTLNTKQEYSFKQLEGKVVLLVNTASKCGFAPQYDGLQKLHEEFSLKGLVVLGFPADNFMHQEPGSDEEIASFCKLNYGVSFPIFAKSSVHGKEISELFAWVTSQEGFSGSILWNFEKFLISSTGKLVARYRSVVKPESKELRNQIIKELSLL